MDIHTKKWTRMNTNHVFFRCLCESTTGKVPSTDSSSYSYTFESWYDDDEGSYGKSRIVVVGTSSQ